MIYSQIRSFIEILFMFIILLHIFCNQKYQLIYQEFTKPIADTKTFRLKNNPHKPEKY